MNAALCEMVVEGVDHNADLQLSILSDENFLRGDYHTNFMEGRG
jgi:acetyl-CoA carboxylase biotin carboxylase subunit